MDTRLSLHHFRKDRTRGPAESIREYDDVVRVEGLRLWLCVVAEAVHGHPERGHVAKVVTLNIGEVAAVCRDGAVEVGPPVNPSKVSNPR